MKTVRISLNSIDKVKSFVNDLAKFDVDFDLVSGRYVIDGKSVPHHHGRWSGKEHYEKSRERPVIGRG